VSQQIPMNGYTNPPGEVDAGYSDTFLREIRPIRENETRFVREVSAPAPVPAPEPPKADPMPEHVTKDELTYRLEAVEARNETRFVELRGEIEKIALAISGDHGIGKQLSELKADNKATRNTIWVAVLAAALALIGVIVAVQFGLVTVFQTVLAAAAVPAK
jgi:hypothetical protein